MKSYSKVIPIILSGGSGSRLWPLSRASCPKQYLNLSSDNNLSLLQNTYKRLIGIKNLEPPIIICNEEHRFIVAEQMKEINIDPIAILLEPFGKNTAPAISISALRSLEFNDDPILLVLAADHEIKSKENFQQSISSGIDHALRNKLVTFGVIPTSPETGYGYIETFNNIQSTNFKSSKIKRFIEKPSKEIAKKFFEEQRYLWNSGIFMFKAKTILKEMEEFSPEIVNFSELSINKSVKDLDFQRLDKDAFEKMENVSIDVAIMEKTKKGIIIPLDAGWNDIGNWKSIYENGIKNNNGNVIKGDVMIKSCKNSYFRSESRLIVGVGLQNMMIIETNDAILISQKDNSQEVKQIVSKLKEQKRKEAIKHKKIFRPWGNFTSVSEESRWQVKRIEVNPGQCLSLQMHHHRAEHWIVVKGTAKIEINGESKLYSENQSTYIPLGSMHRLSNPGKMPLTLIEVQSGSYLGEDDIVRINDNYGR